MTKATNTATAATETDTVPSGPTPLGLPLDGDSTTFIEAGAGTGKTHALTNLVARLVLEEEWPIDRTPASRRSVHARVRP